MTAEKRRTLAQGVAGLCVGLLIASVVWAVATIGQVRETQVERQPQNEANDETLARVKDCTEPGGECFKRSQRATARAVASINEVVVLAASCASGSERVSVEEIQACVIDRLAEGSGR